MDAATELTWTYLQRPPQPDPPRHPTDSPLLLLLLLLPLPLIRQVQGAALPPSPLPKCEGRAVTSTPPLRLTFVHAAHHHDSARIAGWRPAGRHRPWLQ
ncbi:hypothetical protein EGJ89_12340 [Stenotrophomonas maltophilia]|nr:hypothetical protein EGJ89_12340 [Stenotrophomonas maltophilia]